MTLRVFVAKFSPASSQKSRFFASPTSLRPVFILVSVASDGQSFVAVKVMTSACLSVCLSVKLSVIVRDLAVWSVSQ